MLFLLKRPWRLWRRERCIEQGSLQECQKWHDWVNTAPLHQGEDSEASCKRSWAVEDVPVLEGDAYLQCCVSVCYSKVNKLSLYVYPLYFWCVLGGRWVLHPLTLPSWLSPLILLFSLLQQPNSTLVFNKIK